MPMSLPHSVAVMPMFSRWAARDSCGGITRLIHRQFRHTSCGMGTLTEIESLAPKLSDSDRAKLAADLLDSLPGVLDDEDEGITEALRRSEEMDRDPSVCLTHYEFLKTLGRKA